MLRLAPLCGLLVFVAGCSSSHPTGTISGRVQFKGKPVTKATITFSPKDGKTGQPVTTELNADGTYIAANVPYGTLVIGIHSIPNTDVTTNKPVNPSAPPPPAPKPPEWETKYGDPLTSGLTVTLDSATKEHPLDLP